MSQNHQPMLFVSLTYTIKALAKGLLRSEDLRNGLFIFDCVRAHAYNPGASGEYVEKIINEYPDVHGLVVSALCEAEAEGRVYWRELSEWLAYDKLNNLLEANGFKPLMSYGAFFNYPSIKELSTELTVVWALSESERAAPDCSSK